LLPFASNLKVTGLPPIAPPRRRLSTAAYLSGSKRSLHRPINVDYFRPDVDRAQQAVDALFWKPFSWKCGRCRSLTELYVRKQQMTSADQVRAFEGSQTFKLTSQYCAPKRPPPPPRSSSRLMCPSSLDQWPITTNGLHHNDYDEEEADDDRPTDPSAAESSRLPAHLLLPPHESYCSVSSGHSPRAPSSPDLPPIPPPPIPPRMRASFAFREKQMQTSLEDVSDDLSASEERLHQSLTYRSADSQSNRNSQPNASHGKLSNRSMLCLLNLLKFLLIL
jgi:hypothetical protein